MTLFSSVYRSMIAIVIVSCSFVISVSAAGTIPRTDLRLELMLATGIQDTSGLNRIVTTSGSVISFLNDFTYGVPFGQFIGSGGLRVNTSWSTASSDFTISFWMKQNGTGGFLTGATNLAGPVQVKYYPPCSTCGTSQMQDTYTSDIAQSIFTSGDDNSIKFIMNYAGKCAIRGGKGTLQIAQSNMGSYYANTFKILESGTNLQENFNCSILMDNKWHNVILVSKLGTTSVFIDGNEVSKISGAIPVGRYLTIGSSDTNAVAYSGNLFPSQITSIANSKFFRGNITAFRIYSRALTFDETEALLDEFRYALSDLIGAGNITVAMENYSKPNLYVRFKNIPLTLSKELVTYEYATDGQNFTPITNITDTSSSTGSIDYRIGIDLTGRPDGRITVTYRVRAGAGTFQNIGTISFSKIDTPTAITINMPSSQLESSKTITAEAPTASLYMYQTTSSICDTSIGTGSFEVYSDLTFTNILDNGKRICYKAVYSSIGKTIYKISPMIQGIQSTETMTTSVNNSFFSNYTFWTKSLYQKSNDTTAMMLDFLGVSPGTSQGTINGVTMTDINGDGLVDFLYSSNGTSDVYGNRSNYRSIIINNGNYTFKSVYKCVVGIISNISTYYGDCADTTR